MKNKSGFLLSLCLFLILASLYLLTLGGHLYSPDEEVMFRATEALATRGEFAIEPYVMGFSSRKTQPPRADGREIPQYGIGHPLLAVPFYYAGLAIAPKLAERKWISLRQSMRADFPFVKPGESDAVQARGIATRFAVSFVNLFVTAFSGVVLFWLCFALCGNRRAAFLAALLWGAGSMAWPHARTFFSEPLAGLCLLLALCLIASALLGEKKKIWLLIFAGAAAGYGCLTRVDSVVFLPALFLLAVLGDHPWGMPPWLAGKKPAWETMLARAVFFTLPVAAAGALILFMNYKNFGSPIASGYSNQPEGIQFSTPVLAGLYGFLMSVGKGLFFFSPALLLALWGIGSMLDNRRVFGLGIAALFVMFLVAMSMWRNWAGGWCWGPRHIMQIHALLAVPLAFWIADRWDSLRRILILTALVAGAVVQIYGCSQNFIEYYRIYFVDIRGPFYASLLYDPMTEGTANRMFAIFHRDPRTGEPLLNQEAPASALPAPINDSIYIVQNSQWARYSEMKQRGLHDFFWLHAREDAK